MNIFKSQYFWQAVGVGVLVMVGVDIAMASQAMPVTPGTSMGKLVLPVAPATVGGNFPLIGKDIPNITELAMISKATKAIFIIIGGSIGVYSVVNFGINSDKPDTKAILIGVSMAGLIIAIAFFGLDALLALGVNQMQG